MGDLDHLWLHFTEMGRYARGEELQVIVRGDGCYAEDVAGRRYLDALAGFFCVNIGYGFGEEMGEAAAAQMRELPFAINSTFAHPRWIELAAEVAALAPGDLNRVFFVSGGSEAVEASWKLARQHYTARGERRWKAIARRVAYHGTTMGALSINACTELRAPFEPLVPDVLQAGPETVAMVIVEPVQNAGGSCFDEVITGFGRVGHWFGAERFGVVPDLITCAKGLSSAYAAIGALIASERVMEPFLGERIVEHVRDTQADFRAALAQLLELPIVGDLRGAGFFYALELVKDEESRESFSAGQDEFDRIAGTVGTVLEEAGQRMRVAA